MIDKAVRVLNEINALDPTVMPKLIEYRVECNEVLANHPTVQVGNYHGFEGAPFHVGLLGIINGILGDGGYGPIECIVEKDGSISGFRKGQGNEISGLDAEAKKSDPA